MHCRTEHRCYSDRMDAATSRAVDESGRRQLTVIAVERWSVNPLIATLKPQSNGPQ